MAIRFDAADDRLLRNANLPDYDANYTWMCWVRLTSDTGDYENILSLNRDNAGWKDVDVVAADMSGANNRWTIYADINGAGTETTGGGVAVGQWYHIAFVRSAINALKLYVGGALDQTNARDITARAAATQMEIGAYSTNDEQPLDGRIAYVKFWEAALSLPEIKSEIHVIRPQRTANLYGWWPTFPGAAERDNDYSGNGYDWTQVGTLTDEDPPPVSWGAAHYVLRPSAPARIPRPPAAYNTLAIY